MTKKKTKCDKGASGDCEVMENAVQQRDELTFASSTASASIHKLRASNGYLTFMSPETAQYVCKAQVSGGKINSSESIDLQLLLNATHGDKNLSEHASDDDDSET